MELQLNQDVAIDTITKNLIQAGVLLEGETLRYRKLLETYDALTLVKVLIVSHELREAALVAQT